MVACGRSEVLDELNELDELDELEVPDELSELGAGVKIKGTS